LGCGNADGFIFAAFAEEHGFVGATGVLLLYFIVLMRLIQNAQPAPDRAGTLIIMGVAAIFGIFAATYYWFPKMFGRMMNESLGRLHFFLTLAGTYAIFMPMHYLGMAGQTRRYSQFTEVAYQQKLLPLQTFMTYAAIITIAALMAEAPVERTAVILVGRALAAEGFRDSALYDPGYRRRFRPGGVP